MDQCRSSARNTKAGSGSSATGGGAEEHCTTWCAVGAPADQTKRNGEKTMTEGVQTNKLVQQTRLQICWSFPKWLKKIEEFSDQNS